MALEEKDVARQWAYVGLLLITALAALLRFANLGSDSFWFDEILTLNTAVAGWPAIVAVRDHPPLLYLLTALSIEALGVSETAVRLTAAVAGSASVFVLGWWGLLLGRPRAGLWAAFLLALAPFHVRYAQEARHYALLLLFSLLSYLCLTLALKRQEQWRWWLGLALATLFNLYTHYSALLVAVATAVIVAGWLLQPAHRRHLIFPLATAGLIVLGYLPWLSRFWAAFSQNRGIEAASGTTGLTPLSVWLENAFFEFGFRAHLLPWLTLLLFSVGLLILLRQRDWLLLALTTVTIAVSFLLISVFQVARFGFPKYIIFLLPLYLLPAAIALDQFVSWVAGRLPWRRARGVTAAVVAFLLLLLLLPTVRAEHDYVERDWRGAVQAVAAQAAPGDVIIPLTLDLSDRFNQGGVILPYYLDQYLKETIIVDGFLLGDFTEPLPPAATVWLFALNRHTSLPLEGTAVTQAPFAGELSVLRTEGVTPDQQIALLYEVVAPAMRERRNGCIMWENLALRSASQSAWAAADRYLQQAEAQCPERDRQQSARRLAIDTALLETFIDSGQADEAAIVAYRLWQQDRQNEAARALLNSVDLLQRFEAGEATVSDANAPEPVSVRTFTMPQNGERGEVLFVHPPAAVSFALTLSEGEPELALRLAMAPESWSFGGDGSTFVVTLATAAGDEHELLRQHVGNEPEAQRFHPVTLSLTPFAGEAVRLTLATEPGPNGDTTGDWAGFERPLLLQRP